MGWRRRVCLRRRAVLPSHTRLSVFCWVGERGRKVGLELAGERYEANMMAGSILVVLVVVLLGGKASRGRYVRLIMTTLLLYVECMHLPAKVNSLAVQTFMANKSHSDSDSILSRRKIKMVLCEHHIEISCYHVVFYLPVLKKIMRFPKHAKG